MTRTRTPKTEILAQIPAARARGARERAAGRRAVSATYDPSTERILVELTSGYLFGFPAAVIPALARATPAQRAAVELSPGGGGLHWDALDVDLSVAGLLLASVGRREKLRELARVAGSARSERKAAAARANGAKGGRPRKAGRG
jgi:heme exporter protein D